MTDGAVVSATTVNPVASEAIAQPFVEVTFCVPPGAVAAALNVYALVYGELESAPPPVQPAPKPPGKVRWSIPDSGSFDVPVTVKPPAAPCRMYTVVPVTLAFVSDPKDSDGADGAVVSFTVMLGDAPRFVSDPPDEDFCWPCHVWLPAAVGAVAPAPPPAVEPYTIVMVAPPERVTLETVIVWVATETVPVLEVV